MVRGAGGSYEGCRHVYVLLDSLKGLGPSLADVLDLQLISLRAEQLVVPFVVHGSVVRSDWSIISTTNEFIWLENYELRLKQSLVQDVQLLFRVSRRSKAFYIELS